jgi:tetratricopeptide (TPR) repeat protein
MRVGGEKVAKGDTKGGSLREAMEEVAFLRQQCGSLSMRGHYAECAKLIEENLELVYRTERWPENFFSFLKPYQRCYPALGHGDSLEEHVEKLLRKHGIPGILAGFFRSPPAAWSGEHFRDRAVDAKTAGQCGEALDWCDLAIKVDAASSNLYLLRGWILEDLDRGAEAVAAFERALELNETNYKASQGIARQYGRTNLKKALEFIENAISRYPDEPGFLAEKGAVLLKLGKSEEAMACFEKAADIDPYNPEYVYQKGELLLAADKEMAAITQYKRAIGLSDRHVPSLLRMAGLVRQKQPMAALSYITTVTNQEPANREAALLRAQLLTRTGDNPGAIQQYQALLELDENNAEAYAGLASCTLHRDAAHALEYYEKAIGLAPRHAAYQRGKAQALELLGENAKAIEAYRAVLSLDRRSDIAQYRLGLLLAENDREAALAAFEKAIAIAPETGEYHAERGRILLALHREKEAADSLSKACQYDPGNAAYHYELGVLLQQAGNRASSVKNLREAVSLAPSLAPAHRGLAELLLYSEPEDALTHINAAIGLEVANPSHYFLKSRILTRFRDDARALAVLRTRLEAAKDSGDEAYDEIGSLLRGGSLQVAMIHLGRAIELDPQNNAYLCERAHLLYRMGQSGKALAQYQELLKKDANNHEALYGVGLILAAKKDKKALDSFDKAIARSPSTARYHASKAAFLAKNPDTYREAIRCYDTAIPLDTWNYEPILEKATLLDDNGDTYPAIAAYRRVLLVNPNCLPAARRLGELLCDLRPDAAYHYIQHAITLAPEDADLPIRRARILLARGKEEEAAAACAHLLEEAGASPALLFRLAAAFADRYPEFAYPYALAAAEKDPKNGGIQFLCGNILLEREDLSGAHAFYARAAALGVKEGGVREKAVELLYRQGLPEALEAAETLPATAEGFILKAKIYDEVADPPRTAEAVGLLTAAVKNSVMIAEYTPLQVKQSVVGYGKAEKKQVQQMTKTLLSLDSVPKPDDTADALAIAICHAHSAFSQMRLR